MEPASQKRNRSLAKKKEVTSARPEKKLTVADGHEISRASENNGLSI